MVRQTKPTHLADLENVSGGGDGGSNPIEAPTIMPPPGRPASVETRIRYETNVDTASVPPQARYSEELRELAANEFNGVEPPLDPLNAFCDAWADYTGYQLSVTRLPDPGARRIPGQAYNRPCFEVEALGNVPFDPNNLVNDLQMINGNSGGAFRLFLRDDNGNQILGRLDRVVIPDPPRANNSRRRHFDNDDDEPHYRTPRAIEPPPPPQKSDTEIMVENAQRQLFNTALQRALDPPKAPEPTNPVSQLSAEDQLAFNLLKQGNALQSVIDKIAAITQQTDRIEPMPTWKDKLADAGIQLVTQNPAIIAQATDIVTRAAMAVLSAFTPRNGTVINEPLPATTPAMIHHPPAQRLPPPSIQAAPGTASFDEDEDPELVMLEELTKLMLSDKPLRLDDPVILELREAYPQQFDAALAAISATPSPLLIRLICQKSEWAAEMFTSSVTGAHLKRRLEELKQLIKLPPEVTQQINDALQDAVNPEKAAT